MTDDYRSPICSFLLHRFKKPAPVPDKIIENYILYTYILIYIYNFFIISCSHIF